MSKVKGLKVSVEVNGKIFTKEVYVEADKKDKGFCRGKVGTYFFYWRPEKFDLPMLSLTEEQIKALFKGCKNASEKDRKLRTTRELVKKFLLAYKEAKKGMKTTELYGSIPVNPKTNPPKQEAEEIPEGFELVGDAMFGVDLE